MPDRSADPIPPALELELWQTIQQMADDLDEERFDQFLDRCTAEISYRIVTESPDLGREMTYMDLEGDELGALLGTVKQHVRPPDKLLRHTAKPMIQHVDGSLVTCRTKLAVYHVNGSGDPGIYALGHYDDVFSLTEGGPMLVRRDVVLASRRFPFGSHVPL